MDAEIGKIRSNASPILIVEMPPPSDDQMPLRLVHIESIRHLYVLSIIRVIEILVVHAGLRNI